MVFDNRLVGVVGDLVVLSVCSFTVAVVVVVADTDAVVVVAATDDVVVVEGRVT